MTSGTGMAYKRVISDEAKREYTAIVEYLATILKSPQAAAGFMDAIRQAAFVDFRESEHVRSFPHAGARGTRVSGCPCE